MLPLESDRILLAINLCVLHSNSHIWCINSFLNAFE